MLEEIQKYLLGELAVLSKTPLTILLAVALIGIGVWRLMEWAYRHRLSGAQEEVQRLNRQVKDYRDKLEGATPDQAKARLDELERQVHELMPRKMTQVQKQALERELRPLGTTHSITICHDMSCTDGKRYADEFSYMFGQVLKWPTGSASVLGPGTPPPTGLAIRTRGAIPTPLEASVIEAFRRVGVIFDIQSRQGSVLDTDISLLITHRITEQL